MLKIYMKKLFFFLFFIFLANLGFCSVKTNIYVFTSKKCPRCQKEKEFLENIKKNHFNIKIIYLDVLSNKENQKLLQQVVRELNINGGGLPTTIIGKTYFIGFNESTTGGAIENAIIDAKKNNPQDFVGNLIKKKEIEIFQKKPKHEIPEKINIPFLGEIQIKNLSLPILTILFGAIDGFNPCAMWALVMLLSFLIIVPNRKKMFLLGSLFIFVSAFVYFLFMVAWLNFFIFFSYIKWLQILIGLVAILGGLFYLKEFFLNKDNSCKVSSNKFKQKISQKIFFLTENKKIYLAIAGICVLAFFVNLIELICSAGLPVVYTQILSLSSLNPLQYYLYVILYIFVFMLDDLLVFSIAFFSLHLIKLTTKYFRFSHLIGGVILLIIGILLIFKPQYLTF